MRFFFRSKKFRIIVCAVLALIVISVACIMIGGNLSPQSNIAGTVVAPFKYAVTKIGEAAGDLYSALKNGNEMLIEKAELEAELAEMREKLADYEQISADNEFYKEYLEIKDAHPDFSFVSAVKISVDKQDPYKSFVINKGTYNGIKQNDPVITSDGLVGFVSEAGLTTSKISTILSPDIVMGALDNRTSDSGIVYGSLEFAEKGMTGFYNLSRSCNIAIGDYAVTSGEGIFPSGLLIGTIKSIGSDEYNTSIYAEVEPFADFDDIRKVMVITGFEGKGGITVPEGSGE